MKKVIAAFNMTLDGFCDHTAGGPEEEIHQHYTELPGRGDTILYGRTTYQLMEFWRTILEYPSKEESMNAFAMAIDKIPKIVFSHPLKNVDWKSATIANRDVKKMVIELRQQTGKDIYIGSRSLIIQLMNLNLIDESQICVHPVVAAKGLPLFKNINDRTVLKLKKTKTFRGGAIMLYYEPSKNDG